MVQSYLGFFFYLTLKFKKNPNITLDKINQNLRVKVQMFTVSAATFWFVYQYSNVELHVI